MNVRALLIAAMILSAGPALAADKTRFASAKDKVTVFQGNGSGKLQSVAGIEWWTAGEPARKFTQIGTIWDRRAQYGRVTDAIGSAEIAKLALAKGGNALIVTGQETKKVGVTPVYTFGQQSYGPTATVAAPVDEIHTTLAVIKYVE